MENANLKELIAIDLDGSDNLTEDILLKFINKYGPQLQGNVQSHIINTFKPSKYYIERSFAELKH